LTAWRRAVRAGNGPNRRIVYFTNGMTLKERLAKINKKRSLLTAVT